MFRKFFFLFFSIINFFLINKVYSCEIGQFGEYGQYDGINYIVAYNITADCTKDDLNKYFKSLPKDVKQENFKTFISTIMTNNIQNPQVFIKLSDLLTTILPSSITQTSTFPSLNSTMVELNSVNNQGTGTTPEDFQTTFGVPFNNQNFGKYIAAGALGSVSSAIGIAPTTAIEISNAVLAGESVVNFIQSGSLKKVATSIGDTLALGFKTLVYGEHEPDYVADANIHAEQNAIDSMYDNYKKALIDWETKLDINSYNLSVASEMQWKSISNSLDNSKIEIQKTMDQIKSNQDSFNETLDKVTSVNKKAEADLNKTENEIQELRKGLMSDEAIEKTKNELASHLITANSDNPLNGLAEISGEFDSALFTTNQLRAAQMKNLLKDFIDDNGILTSLSANEESLNGYKFQTDLYAKDNSNAELIRNAVNGALALKHYASNETELDRGNTALKLALAADQAYGKGDSVWGDRNMESSLEIASFKSHDSNYNYLSSYKLTNAAKENYNLNLNSDTFEHYKLIELANKFADNNSIQTNPYLKIIAESLIQQANLNSNGKYISPFMQTVQNGFLFLDSVTSGITSGIKQFVVNTATGISQLVAHPIDSVDAMYNAISNYKQTWNVVKNNLNAVIHDYPNYSTEQKAQFISKTSLDIASLLLPVSEVANIAGKVGEFSKIGDTLNAVTSSIVNYTYNGIEGLNSAEKISPGYISYLENIDGNLGYGGALELGNNLSNASPEFISGLMNYSKTNTLELGEVAAISRFKDGFSRLVPQSEFNNFVLNGNDDLLGSPPSRQIFASTHNATDEVILEANGDRNIIRSAVGWNSEYFEDEDGLVRIELPFSFTYTPRLPTGTEKGANEFFIPGGFTTGRMPEIILKNVPRNDITGGFKNGYKILIPKEN